MREVIVKYGWKEFFKRWKAGIDEVTPLQQTNAQILFTRITLIGITCGSVIAAIAWKNLWWLGIIMLGAFGNTWVGLIALKQKQKLLKNLEGGLDE